MKHKVRTIIIPSAAEYSAKRALLEKLGFTLASADTDGESWQNIQGDYTIILDLSNVEFF